MAGEYVDVVVDHPGASAIVLWRRWSVEWLRNQSGSRVKPDHCVRIYRRMHHGHRRGFLRPTRIGLEKNGHFLSRGGGRRGFLCKAISSSFGGTPSVRLPLYGVAL